ncbi:RNA polymerase sigma factor SigJ [Actinomadura rupiterrae]|uniref:RNA polymerase sigma factor SigJ n=1 Tax=Actinomadura rupiterrae TaxID=559627 RepID=UPI0020A57369|nr:RNA polymerase sigma factor SigJ [Actinomadura rupiterrae]MCP2342287.1 RNA polymerase sigma-70 factor (ECF subfamily) [Actinomadura rupiterrae]
MTPKTDQPDAAPSAADSEQPDAGLAAVVSERRQLMGLAYRLLGSVSEAEDAVQETYARWYALSREEQDGIANPGAWLTRVAGRVCLDLLGSARARRERYVGEWIPEPVPERTGWISGRPAATAAPADPADRVTLDESVGMAFLVVLEEMTPAQRVALILHDVFGYAFSEIAEVTGRSPGACRELASAARRRARAAAPQAAAPAVPRDEVVKGFKAAMQARDITALVGLLDPDAVLTADGGGLVVTTTRPVEGRDRVARYLLALTTHLTEDVTLRQSAVNGQPGLVVRQDGHTTGVYAFDIADGRIRHIWAVRNPDKLRPWDGTDADTDDAETTPGNAAAPARP